MNPRIEELRNYSLTATNRICPERASLITEFYKSQAAREISVPMRRALAFKYFLEHKTIYIHPGELIVGERGSHPKAASTYPEICLHSITDLKKLDARPKIPYAVDEHTISCYQEEIIPFWQDKSIRDRLFREVSDEWKAAYEAGIFTEFQEQRAPGHTVAGEKLFQKGFLDLLADVQEQLSHIDFYTDPDVLAKKEQLSAMAVAAEALVLFARRYAQALQNLAAQEPEPQRKQELEEMARICDRVPAHAPKTFHEALQFYWFVHLGVICELNPWDSFSPGRLDQHLYPFYKQEIAAGTLTEERAKELLQAFWIKFNNHPAPPKMGVTAKESGTYTDFCTINIGGLKVDGSDAVNDLSYLLLDVIEEMRLLQPSSMIQVSKKNPDRLIKRAIKILKTGFGQPSIFNTDAIIQELTRQGKSIEDARQGGASGCVESGAFGKECYILTGYFNLPKVLEVTLHNGTDPRTGKKIGLQTGEVSAFESYEQLLAAFERQLNHFVDIKIRGNNIISAIYAHYMPVPFLSLLIDDCIAKGRDYNNGGAKYNARYIQGVGIGSIADALTGIKYHVFDKKNLSMQAFMDILNADFAGHEEFRQQLLRSTPKYGNDDDYADDVMREVFEMFFYSVDGRAATVNAKHHILMLPTTCHVYFGSVIGALPDGRKAKMPLSEGISPVQGADVNGPTAVIKSASKMDHFKTGGTLLNQKFTPQFFKDDASICRLMQLVRTYFKLDGHHIQFNVVDVETLRKAKAAPEEYRSLIVRVAGYSDYFVDLSEELQDEIIQRTEHQNV